MNDAAFATKIAATASPATSAEALAADNPAPGHKVSIRDLRFYYGDALALKSVTLPLIEKKVTAFIGPSGCGKSTLLRVLNRMYDLYPKQRAEGEVILDGENILSPNQDVNLLRSKVGMVFQKPTPFPMTIYNNIAFGIQLYERPSRAELAVRVEAALTKAALWEGKDEALAELSQPSIFDLPVCKPETLAERAVYDAADRGASLREMYRIYHRLTRDTEPPESPSGQQLQLIKDLLARRDKGAK
jgi:ABC-type multidrug transport system fused ATPase/permease subunit